MKKYPESDLVTKVQFTEEEKKQTLNFTVVDKFHTLKAFGFDSIQQ